MKTHKEQDGLYDHIKSKLMIFAEDEKESKIDQILEEGYNDFIIEEAQILGDTQDIFNV